jgi:hypothetical protein
MSFLPEISALDKSLFGGLRAHSDLPILERTHDYPGPGGLAYDPDLYGWATTGVTIAHDVNTRELVMTSPSGAAGVNGGLRTHDPIRYQPGCMPAVLFTGRTSAAFTTLKVKRRSSCSGVATDYTLATITGFDSSKENLYEIQYAYLGVRAARFIVNGLVVHLEEFSGKLTEPYMKTAVLPLSMEFVNTAANTRELRMGVKDDDDGLFFVWEVTSAASLDWRFKCASARLVGGGEYPYMSYGFSFAASGVSTTLIPLFSLRPNATINGVSSRAQVFPRLLSFFSETQPGAVELIINPTLTGATWGATSPSAAVQVDTAATVTTGGTTIWRIGQGADAGMTYQLDSLFTLIGRKLRRQAFTGTADILTVAVQREGSVNFSPRVTLGFDELR